MPTGRPSFVRRLAPGAAALSVFALVGTSVAVAVNGRPRTTPVPSTPRTASLPDGTVEPGACGFASAGIRTCNLTAVAGTISLPGQPSPTPIWGFSTTGIASVPGPLLVALDNETIHINVVNSLPAFAGNLAIEVAGANTATADSTGVAPGSATPAQWTGKNLPPGTYIYEAAPLAVGSATDNASRQIAMGLSGTLIVRPHDFDQTSATTAVRYALPGSSANGCTAMGASGFSAEALVQVSEISTEFNNDTAGGIPHGLAPYEPNYFLINGHPFTATAPTIDVAQGDCLLLRYANLGEDEHSMGPFGARQTIIAEDSRPPIGNTPRSLDAEYLTPGQTADALVQISANSHVGDQIPLIDLGRNLHNDLSTSEPVPSLGGAAIAINVVAETAAASLLGPAAQVSVTPATNDGTDTLHVVAILDNSATGASWYLDSLATLAHPITTYTSAPIDATHVSWSFDITAADAGLAVQLDGDHLIWVQATDGINLGSPGGDVFTLNRTGPSIYALVVDPTPTNGNTQNKPAGALPPVVSAAFTAGTPNRGTVDFGTANPGLAPGEPLQLFGFSPASWNNNFTVESISGNTVTFSFGAMVAGTPTATGTAFGGAQQSSSDVLVSGTIEPSLADYTISKVDWCVIIAGVCSADPNLFGTVTYFDPGLGTVPPQAPPPGPGTPVPVAITIPQAGVLALGEATYSIQVIATEALYSSTTTSDISTYTLVKARANDGLAGRAVPATVPLVVDKTGPTTAITAVSPDPAGLEANNSGNLNYFNSIRVKATFTDPSPITNAEIFITHVGDPAPGSAGSPWQFSGGTQMTPDNAVWGGTPLSANSDIPAAEFSSYDQGMVRIWVHAQDAAGNWGPMSASDATTYHDLTLDRTPPVTLDHTSTVTCPATAPPAVPSFVVPANGCWDAVVENPSATTPYGTLDLWAMDVLLAPNAPATWAPLSTKVASVEWRMSFNGVAGTELANLFVYNVPDYTPNNSPVHIRLPMIFPGPPPPQVLTAPATVVYRLRDTAGNYSAFYEVTILP